MTCITVLILYILQQPQSYLNFHAAQQELVKLNNDNMKETSEESDSIYIIYKV